MKDIPCGGGQGDRGPGLGGGGRGGFRQKMGGGEIGRGRGEKIIIWGRIPEKKKKKKTGENRGQGQEGGLWASFVYSTSN